MANPAPPAPASGPIPFGKYQLVRKLATGGMGEVYLAKQVGPVGFEKTLVIKRILAKHLDKQAYVDMFFSEARLAALLNHSNIVQIYDMGEEQEHFFIAMEYVHGRSLREVIDVALKTGRPVPLAYILEIMAQVCAGMSYAHNLSDPSGQPLNLVHRDINPQNVMVSYHGEAKVIDFGIAKSSVNTHKTEAGTIKGKYVYMSPEQSAAEPLDKRSDLFALGIVMYELCTGANPFHHNTIVASLEAIQRKDPPPLEIKRPDCAIFAPIVAKALAKERDDRYADAADIREDILDLQQTGQVERVAEPLSAYLTNMFAASAETSNPGARTPSSTSGSGKARPRSTSNAATLARSSALAGSAGPAKGPTPPSSRVTPPPAHPPAPRPAPSNAPSRRQDSGQELFPDAERTELEQDVAAREMLAKVSVRKKSKSNSTAVYALLGVLAAVVVLLGAGIAARVLGLWPRAAEAPAPAVTAALIEKPKPAAAPAAAPAPAEKPGLGKLSVTSDATARITCGDATSTAEGAWTLQEPAGQVRVQGASSFDATLRYTVKDGRLQLTIHSEPAAALLVNGQPLGATPQQYAAATGETINLVFQSSSVGAPLNVSVKFAAP